MSSFERRKYNREWARDRRDRKLEASRLSARVCPRRFGKAGICGSALVSYTDGNGNLVVRCPACERFERGLCRDCNLPVEGAVRKARRCAKHKREALREQLRKYQRDNREEVNRRAVKALAEMTPEQRERRNYIKRLWRKANPEKVREMKQRYLKRYGSKPDSRYIDYHRRYNAQVQRQRKKREQAKAAYYAENPVRPDPHCTKCGESIAWVPLPGGRGGRPAAKCDNCCTKYELAARAKRREAAVLREAKPAKKGPRPIRVKKPQPHRYAPTGERLCVTEGCQVVLTHKKKKCTKCRQREIAEANRKRIELGVLKPSELERVA